MPTPEGIHPNSEQRRTTKLVQINMPTEEHEFLKSITEGQGMTLREALLRCIRGQIRLRTLAEDKPDLELPLSLVQTLFGPR